MGYEILTPKTEKGERYVPMQKDVADCFRRIIQNRKHPKIELMIDGYSGFLFLDKNDMPMVALHWEKYFQHIREKYNSIYKVQMPCITPHVCRHTFCYQLTSFHSLMIEKSYQKNIGKVTRFTNADEIYEFDELFHRLFSKKNETGKSRLDSSCEFLRGELLQYGFKPEYIALDLDHQFDEFHTYDGFYHGDSNKEALKITDIWTFVVSALMQAPL